MNNLLLSEKWRPKTIEDAIILPRVYDMFKDGLDQNVILYGSFGTGKTTISRILVGKYTKDKPYLEINSSFYTSIDVLRNKIDDFCSKVYMGLDLDDSIGEKSMKYVFLDEFDRTSMQYQDALKAYIEEFSAKNVRFILTTNHINKISPGVRSRFIEVNFDCQSKAEEKYLKTQLYKRIVEKISPDEGIEIPKDKLISLINRKFPDIRSIMIDLDNFRHTGFFDDHQRTVNSSLSNELYNIACKKSSKYEEVYNFIFSNFGQEKIDEMISLFGRGFTDYIISDGSRNTEVLFKVSSIVCEHQKLLESSQIDPIIVAMSFIGKIREAI